MPIINVEGPPLDVERKRLLVKKLTEVAIEIYNIEHIIILVRENQPENVGINGQLLVDSKNPPGSLS